MASQNLNQDMNQEMDAEIDILRQEQVALRKHSLLWGFASNGVARWSGP